MKSFLTLLVIAIVGFGVWTLIQTKPDESTPQAVIGDASPTEGTTSDVKNKEVRLDTEKSIDNNGVTVAFTGFGPGKKHDGNFNKVTSNLTLTKGIVGGSITVDMNSLQSDMEAVTKHLKTGDFFDVAKYPTATFTVTEDLTASICSGDMVRCKAPYLYGTFTIHGVTKSVSFPVTKTDAEYSSTFTINMKEFGIDQTFANEVVELRVVAPVK